MTKLDELKAKYHVPKPSCAYMAVQDEHKLYKRRYRCLELFKKQGGKCFYCGCQMLLHKKHHRKPQYLTIDHYFPKCRGGTLEGDNAVAACQKCNSAKSVFDA